MFQEDACRRVAKGMSNGERRRNSGKETERRETEKISHLVKEKKRRKNFNLMKRPRNGRARASAITRLCLLELEVGVS